MNSKLRAFFSLCTLAALIAVTHELHINMANLAKSRSHPYKLGPTLPSADTIRMLSLGFTRVAADLYWLMFIQYYGDPNAAVKYKYLLAPEYLELIIKLDPHFIEPYWFASFILGSELKLKKESEEILDFGIKENPDSWVLPYVAGFNQFLYLQNDKKAAEYYRIGASRPHAPKWLAGQVEIMESKVPRLLKSTQVWWRIYDTTNDPMLKEKARIQLIVLFSRIYWTAPTKQIRDTAMMRLQSLDGSLLPKQLLFRKP